MSNGRKRTARRLLLPPAAAWALLAAGGYFPTRVLAGEEGLRAMWLAQSLVAVVVLATMLVAMGMVVKKSPVDRFKLAMLAGTVRFLATAGLLTAVAWLGQVHVVVFLVWGAATYLLMAILEAVALARWFRYLESETRC